MVCMTCAVSMCFVLQDFTDVLMSEDAATANRIDGTEESEEEDSGGSEEERSICLSPSKSPRKISRVLKRKRTPSEDLEEASDAENSEESTEDVNSVALKDKEPTDEDFQFKEPKFRKKKFIFHPFSRNSEGSLVPDPSSSAVEVSSLLSSQYQMDQIQVVIPEQLAASYGLYIWPCAPVLAWYSS